MRRTRSILWLVLLAAVLCVSGCMRQVSTPGAGRPVTHGAGPADDAQKGLTVRFLDIGQGDSALIQWAGHAMLIDGGPRASTDVLLSDLARFGVTKIDWMVASHPHEDHIGGLIGVLNKMPVANFLDSGLNTGSPIQVQLLKAVQKQKTRFQVAKAGTRLDLGDGATLEILAPPDPLLKGTTSDPNNNSIVARLVYGNTRILFTGDMEGPERGWLFNNTGGLLGGSSPLAADVLKAAHHGSRNGTNAALLKRVEPRYVVISCAQGNSYGHPHKQALAAIKNAPSVKELFRTDLEGIITLRTDGNTFTITPDHPPVKDIWTPGDNRSRRKP